MKAFSVQIDQDMDTRLRRLAEQRGAKLIGIIRLALEQYLDREERIEEQRKRQTAG